MPRPLPQGEGAPHKRYWIDELAVGTSDVHVDDCTCKVGKDHY